VDDHLAAAGLYDDHQLRARVEPRGNRFAHLTVAVVGRNNLDGYVGRAGRAYRARVALEDEARLSGINFAEAMFVHISF
jgi:hypothetical protein